MKMTKRVCSLLFVIAILFTVVILPASAETTSQPRVVDQSDLFSPDEEAKLTEKLTDYSKKQNCDIVFLTVDDFSNPDFTFNGTTADYADTYYDTHNYAKDGVLVMLVQNNEKGKRHIYFSTTGKCKSRLTEDEWNEIIDDIEPIIPPREQGKNGNFYPTFDKIADELNVKLTPFVKKWYAIPIAIFIGLVIAIVIMLAIRSKLKTVAMQHGAKNYVREGSMNVTAARDTYLYSTVSRTRRQKSESHTSSGGGSHSGGGRDI